MATRSRTARLDTELVTRVAVLEERIDGYPPREWVKDFVNEAIRPQAESIMRMEQTVKQVSEDASALFAAHDKMLQERAQREKDEHAAKLAELQNPQRLPCYFSQSYKLLRV